MMQHLDCGKHQRALEQETLFDKAVLEYAEHLEGQPTLVPVVSMVSTRASHADRQVMGWALKSSESRRIRFTQNQKSYLTAKFRLGEETGNKADPAAVARSMMCAKDSTGNMLFKSDEFLTANQIAGFFSRLASKKTLVVAISRSKHMKPVWKNLSAMLSVSLHLNTQLFTMPTIFVKWPPRKS